MVRLHNNLKQTYKNFKIVLPHESAEQRIQALNVSHFITALEPVSCGT